MVCSSSRKEIAAAPASAASPAASADIAASSSPASSRRAALFGVASAAAFAVAPAGPALANPLDGLLAAKALQNAKFFMGPLALTKERLTELQKTETQLTVEELATKLGLATLDCLNPGGVLAAYANVRAVCTLRILLNSVTNGPAMKNDPDSLEAKAAVATYIALTASYDELAAELSREASAGSRDAAFKVSQECLRGFAVALLGCFRLPAEKSDEVKAMFPDLFA